MAMNSFPYPFGLIRPIALLGAIVLVALAVFGRIQTTSRSEYAPESVASESVSFEAEYVSTFGESAWAK